MVGNQGMFSYDQMLKSLAPFSSDIRPQHCIGNNMRIQILLTLGLLSCTLPAFAQQKVFPPDITENDVKKYGAKGDGVTDDTAAIRAAIIGDRTPQAQEDYYFARPRLVFFPKGTYLVSDTIDWLGCSLQVQGSGDTTVIKLKDGATGYNDPTKRKPVLRTTAGNYSFKQHIWDLVVDTGKNNAGAVGLDWIANNVGSLRNITVRSGDGKGVAGVDMTRSWPGPCLVRDLVVQGFDYGIDVANSEYGPTFESLTLTGQKKAAFRNDGNVVAVRKLHTVGAPVAVDSPSAGSMVILLDSTLEGGSGGPAIRSAGNVFLRNVTATGYANLLNDKGFDLPGLSKDEYTSGAIQSLFPSPQKSIGLPIAEVPSVHDNDLSHWKKFACGYQFCESVIQPTLDSGASTVYFSSGAYLIGGKAFKVPPTVKRVLGFGSNMNSYDNFGMTFEVDDDSPDPLVFEQFASAFKIIHSGKRPIVVKSCDLTYTAKANAGSLTLDDVGMDLLKTVPGQQVWGRNLNMEGDQLHIDNVGGYAWVFGFKSERRGMIARTTQGGYTEFLGTLLYGTDPFAPEAIAFQNVRSSHSIVFAESTYIKDGFYPTIVDETRDGQNKRLPLSALDGRFMPLFVGYKNTPPVGADGRLPVPDGGIVDGPPGSTPSGTQPPGSTPSGTQPPGSTPSGTQPPGSTPSGTQPPGSTPSGTNPATDGGCGCQSAESSAGRASLYALGAIMIVLARRRTRRSISHSNRQIGRK